MTFIIPYIFEAGQKAVAQEVNDNFEYLKQSLEGVNSTLEAKVNAVETKHDDDISKLQTQAGTINQIIEDRDTIVRLGTINAPDALEDGSIPTAEFSLEADRIHTAAIAANAAVTLPVITGNTKYVNCMLEFTLAEGKTLTLPNSVKHSYGLEPVFNADGVTRHRFLFDTTNGGEGWMCYFSKDDE